MRRWLVTIVVAALAAGACSDSAAEPEGPDGAIEVFTVYRGADAEAFRAVLDRFEEATGYTTVHVGTAGFVDRLEERINEGAPPDVALFPQPSLIKRIAADGDLAAFGEEAESAVRANYDPQMLKLGIVDGTLYAIPWKIDLKSLVWYRPEVFADHGYVVPKTFDDLQALVAQMAADNMTPWCMGMEAFEATGWVGTDWIEDLMLRTQSPEVYDQWADGTVAFDDDRVRQAFTLWNDLTLQPGRTVGGTRAIINTPWQVSGDPLFAEEPGCMMVRQGSIYQEYLPEGTEIGPDGDVNAFVMPGGVPADPPLLLAGQFAAGFNSDPGVEALLAYLATPESGVPWAEAGGYLSPHAGFVADAIGDGFGAALARIVADASLTRFDAFDTMEPAVGVGTFWDGVVEFVATRDLDRAIATIESGYSADP